jgi:hypothetical protein
MRGKHMAGPDNKEKSNDLDLDVKITGPVSNDDQAGGLADEDLNKVAGGQRPLKTITCDEECDSYACRDTYC